MAHAVKLRESGQQAGLPTDLGIVTGAAEDPDGGVPGGAALVGFVNAVLADEGIPEARARLVEQLGPHRAARAAEILAGFDGINRVADATGMRLTDEMLEQGQDLIADLGLERMQSAD